MNHRRARLAWARAHAQRTVAHWQHVIFTNESHFRLYTADGLIRIHRLQQETHLEEGIQETVQAGGGQMSVWGGIHSTAKTPLVVYEGGMTGVKYREVLEQQLVPYARGVFQNNFCLQDDNAPPHRARVVTNYLENEEIQRLD